MNQLKPKRILFAGLVLLGLMLYFVFPGYDFSGLFTLGLAMLIPVFHLLRGHPWMKRALCALLAVLFGAVAVTYAVIGHYARGTVDAGSRYLIVLGAGVNGTTPSLSLRERLDAALDYLNTHPDAVAIVSGGQGSGEDITEAQCMYNYLTAHGIEPDRVWMEDQATRTLENLEFSLDLIESRTGIRPRQVAIVSSEYHLFRAKLFAAQLGLDTELIPARTTFPPLRWNYQLREVFAVWYYAITGGINHA